MGDRVGRVRAGLVLGDTASVTGQAARWLPHEPGVFGLVITDQRVPDAEAVVEALRDAGWNGTDAIRLFLCDLPGLPELAARLVDQLKVRVAYPQDQVWFGTGADQQADRPAARVGRLVHLDGVPMLRLAKDGAGWVWKEPGGAEKPAPYVLTAPSHAPRLGLQQPVHLGPRATMASTAVELDDLGPRLAEPPVVSQARPQAGLTGAPVASDSQAPVIEASGAPAPQPALGTETRALPGVARTIPGYFRRGKAPGIATQLSRTEQVDQVVESARSFAPKAPAAAELADLEHAFGNDVASFFGEGRVFTMGGRPVRIRVDELHWPKQTAADRTGTTKAATHESAGSTGTRTATKTNPRTTWIFFTPMVPGLFATGVVSAPTAVATSRRHGHDLAGSKQVSVSLPARPANDESGYQGTRSVMVPMTVIVEPEEHRSDDGKLSVRHPGDSSLRKPIAAEFSVPEGLREEGRVVPMPDALPPSATESLTVKRGTSRQIFDQVLARLGKVSDESREVLREFLSTGSITTHLANIAVTPHADPESGWVTSHALVRGGNPIKRLVSSRSQKVQMRAVARKVAYLETIEDAEFREHEAETGSKTASSTVGRETAASLAGGPGFDYGMVSAGGGPAIGVGYGKSRTATSARESGLSVTRSYKDSVVRYRTVYDLQVRTPGRSPLTFAGVAEGTQWAQLDDARQAGLLPGENTGTGTKAQPGPGTAAAGAPLQLNEASARLKKILHESAKMIPGHKRWGWRDAGLVTPFDDPKLKKGLTGKLERQLERWEAIESAVSADNLARRLPYLLSDKSQFLELAPEAGWGHDYRTGFQIDARLLAPLGEPLGPVKGGAGTRVLTDAERGEDTIDIGMDLSAGFRARIYGLLSGNTVMFTGTHKFSFNRTRATGRGRDTELAAGGTAGRELDESGAVIPEPKYRYAAKVELKVSGSYYSRYNELAQGLTFGKRGEHVPEGFHLPIIDSQAAADGRAPQTIVADVVLELTEAERNALQSVSATKETRLPSQPLNKADYLRTGTSRVLDGVQVLSVSGLDQVRRRVKRTLRRASGDPIWNYRDGDNSTLIDQAISAEALRLDSRAFNRPTRIDGLRWKRRRAIRTAAVGVSYRLRDPEVLDTFWQQPRQGAGTSTSTSSEKGRSWGFANEFEPAVFGVSDGTAHPDGTVLRGVAPVLAELNLWRSSISKVMRRKTRVSTNSSQTLEPRRVHVVEATLETTVSVETARRGLLDRWHFRKTRPPKTAAHRSELPRAARVLLTDEQLHEVRIQQAAEDARRGIASSAPVAPLPAGGVEGVPAGHELGGANWADGVSEPVDLSGSLYQADEPDGAGGSAGLYERLENALTKERADQLLNSAASDTGHDNHSAIVRFLSDFQASMADLVNGGVSAGLRLDDRLSGQTYDLIVEARPKSAPKPVGVVHGELTKTSVASVWAATTRSVKRSFAELMTVPAGAMMFQSESDVQEAQQNPGKHGAPAGTLGYGAAHLVDWLNQFRSRTTTRTEDLLQSETVSGALAERSVELEFDIRFERHGERIADISAERTVRTRSAVEDRGTGDEGPREGTVIRRPETEAAKDSIDAWRKPAGSARLPDDPADFRIAHFDGRVDSLRDAARTVLEAALGKKLDARTLAMLREQLTPSQLNALARSHFGAGSASSLPAEAVFRENDDSTGTELNLPSELGVKLTLHAMLDGPGSLENVSGRITMNGHTDAVRTKESSGGSETANAVMTMPVWGAGVPQAPGHTTYEEGRQTFGSMTALFFGSEPHGALGVEHEHESAERSGGRTLAKPGAPAAVDPVTSTWSYPTRFRLVAEPLSTGPVARRTKQVADVDYDKGYHVRRKDQNHRLPASLKDSALALAARDREWTEARGKARALAAKNPSGAGIETAFERRAAAKFWKAKRDYDHALAAAQANPALHGGRRVVRMEIPPRAEGVPVEYWKPLSGLARDLLAAHAEGRRPTVRYRVIGDSVTALRDFNGLVMAKLDSFVNLEQLSVPPLHRLGRHQVGLAAAPEVLPGTGPSVIEIWVDEKADRLPMLEADDGNLPPIWEEDEPDSDSDEASPGEGEQVPQGTDDGAGKPGDPPEAPALPGGQRLLRVELSPESRDGDAALQKQARDVARFLLDNPGAELQVRVSGDEAEDAYQALVEPALDAAVHLEQVSFPGAAPRTGKAALGLPEAPVVVPGDGHPVVEIWGKESEDGAAAGSSHPGKGEYRRLKTIAEEDESGSSAEAAPSGGQRPGGQGDGASPTTPATGKSGPSFREAMPEYARDGKALGLVVVSDVKDRDKVGDRITELLAPFGTAAPEGIKAISGKLNRARFESFLGAKPGTEQAAETAAPTGRGGRNFQVRVGKKWFDAHVVAVMDLDGATPGEGKREPSRAVREVRDEHVFGHSHSRAENSAYRLGLSGVSLMSSGWPVLAGGSVGLARPVGVRTSDTSTNAQTIWRAKSEAQSAKVPVKYYITLTGEDGAVTGGTTDGEVTLLLSDSLSEITKPEGVSTGKPYRGWEKRMGFVAVDAVLIDELSLVDKLQRKLHPSVTRLGAPGWAALREFVSSANIRALSRRMWPGEAVPSADLVSRHGAYREAARMNFRPQEVEFVGVVSARGESRTQDTVTAEESVAYTTKAGPELRGGIGGGAGVPGVAAAYGGAAGNVNASIPDIASGGRSDTTGTGLYVQGDVGLYRVTGEVAVQTSHGQWVTEPATKYVRLDLHEAAAENLPVPPGHEKRFIDVGPRFEPPYLAAAAAGGHIRAGVTPAAAGILPRIENALRRAPGLEDLLPKWSSQEEKTVRGSGDKMERRLSNQRKLASVFSATALMNRLDSLLGPGVSTQLKRRGFFFDEFISVRVKATLDDGRHLGQVDGRTVAGIQATGATVAGGAGVNRGWGAGPEARGRVGFTGALETGAIVNVAATPVKFADGRAWKNTGGSGRTLSVEQVGTDHSHVFAHGITFDIEIVSHRRPRRWVRRLTPGSPRRSIPKVRTLAGSRPGAEITLPKVKGRTELWVSESAVYETDPSEFAPGPSKVVHLDPGQTPSIDELAASAGPMPDFLYVEAFAHAGELGELAVDLSNRATKDDEVLVLPGSKGHQLVHQWFAPETLRGLLKSVSIPAFRRNGLSYGRRATKRIGALGMRLELTDPVVVRTSDVGRDKTTFSGTTKAASEYIRVKALGPSATMNFFAPDATSTSVAGGRMALGGAAKFWGRKRGRASEQTVMVDHKEKGSEHSRTVLVRYDVRSRMVVESRQKRVVDGEVSVAGADKYLPGSLFVRMSERQARAQGLLPPAEPRETVPKLGAPDLSFGSSGSLGAYVAEDLPDLSSLLPTLRAGLPGKHRGLIPESMLEDAMGTAERLGELVNDANATSLLDNALDGGVPLRVHKPGVLWSDDYNVVLKATAETVEFDGYVNDGSEIEQAITNTAMSKTVEERSKSRGGWFRPGWRSLFSAGESGGGGAMGGSAGLGGTRERTDRRVTGSGLTSIRATTGSGPGARYRVGLRWELKIEREGREVASSALTDHITIRTNADDQRLGGGAAPEHRNLTIPVGRHTDASVKEWQSEGVKLPVDVLVEGFRGAADIRDGVVRAMKDAGAKAGLTSSETGAMNTLALSVTNSAIRANLVKTSAGSLPLPDLYTMSLTGGQQAKVKIYSRLSGVQIAGLSDTVRFDQSAKILESFTSDTAQSGSSGTQLAGGDGGITDRAGNLHIPGGADSQSATASGQLAGATAGQRSVTLQDTGRSGLTKFDTEHFIVAEVDGVTSAVVVRLPASALPRVINAGLAKVLGAPLPETAVRAQDRVTQAAALWRAKETILHRKQGVADRKWFDEQGAEQRLREVAGVPGEVGLDPRIAAQRARAAASVATLRADGTDMRDEAREQSRSLAATLAQEEAKLDAAAEELAQARAELTKATQAADAARAAWLRAKEELETELAKINAGLREQNGAEAADSADERSRISLPDWVRRKAIWARELLETEPVSVDVLAGLTEEARQTLTGYFPRLSSTVPGTGELREVLHTILTAERVHYHLDGESPAAAAALLRVLAQELAAEVKVPEAVTAEGERGDRPPAEVTDSSLLSNGVPPNSSVPDSAAGNPTGSDEAGQTFLDSDSESGSSAFEPDAGRALVTWEGRSDGSGRLTGTDHRTVTLMVEGFVDAAVAARPGAEPTLRGGVFVSPDARDGVSGVSSLVESAVRARLNAYPPGAAGISAEKLLSRVRVSAIERPSGDPSVGTVQLQVSGQRPVMGLFGPEVFTAPANPLPRRAEELARARAALAGLEDSDPVFALAREIVSRHHQAPRPFVETASWADRAHRARYRAAVDLVAWNLYRYDDEHSADALSRALVSEVMWPREKGLQGGAPPRRSETARVFPVPEDVAGWRAGDDSTGPQTLREHLVERGLPAGFVLKSDTNRRSNAAARTWIRAWAARFHGVNDVLGEPFTRTEVAHLSGELIDANEIGRLWNDLDQGKTLEELGLAAPTGTEPEAGQASAAQARPVEVPADVVGWRPEEGGPETLRAYLEARDLPEGVSVTPASGRLNVATMHWVRAWVEGRANEVASGAGQRYSHRALARLSGGLVSEHAVGMWLREARSRVVQHAEASSTATGRRRTQKTRTDLPPDSEFLYASPEIQWTGQPVAHRAGLTVSTPDLQELERVVAVIAPEILLRLGEGAQAPDLRLRLYVDHKDMRKPFQWERLKSLGALLQRMIDDEVARLSAEIGVEAESFAPELRLKLDLSTHRVTVGDRMRFELLRFTDRELKPSDYRGMTRLAVAFSQHSEALPLAHADQLRWVVQGEALRALLAGEHRMSPIAFVLDPAFHGTPQLLERRKAHLIDSVKAAVTTVLDVWKLAGSDIDLDSFLGEVKIEHSQRHAKTSGPDLVDMTVQRSAVEAAGEESGEVPQEDPDLREFLLNALGASEGAEVTMPVEVPNVAEPRVAESDASDSSAEASAGLPGLEWSAPLDAESGYQLRPDDLQALRAAVRALVPEVLRRQQAGLQAPDIRLVLVVRSEAIRPSAVRAARLQWVATVVRDELERAGVVQAGLDEYLKLKISAGTRTGKGKIRLELLHYPDEGKAPSEYQRSSSIGISFPLKKSDPTMAQADRIRWMAQGEALRSLSAGKAKMRPFTLVQARSQHETDDLREQRRALVEKLVRDGVRAVVQGLHAQGWTGAVDLERFAADVLAEYSGSGPRLGPDAHVRAKVHVGEGDAGIPSALAWEAEEARQRGRRALRTDQEEGDESGQEASADLQAGVGWQEQETALLPPGEPAAFVEGGMDLLPEAAPEPNSPLELAPFEFEAMLETMPEWLSSVEWDEPLNFDFEDLWGADEAEPGEAGSEILAEPAGEAEQARDHERSISRPASAEWGPTSGAVEVQFGVGRDGRPVVSTPTGEPLVAGGESVDDGLVPVPVEVLRWRPSLDGSGPRTLQEFLIARDLPTGVVLKSATNRTSSKAALGWIRAWAAGLRETNDASGKPVQLADIAKMSGGLIAPATLSRLWRDLRAGKTSGELGLAVPAEPVTEEVDAWSVVPEDVLRWRPAVDGSGPRTLREFLLARGLPQGIVLRSATNRYSSRRAQAWIEAWAEGMREAKDPEGNSYPALEVSRISGGLIGRDRGKRAWEAVAGRGVGDSSQKKPARDERHVVPDEVVDWRPAVDGSGPQTLREFLLARGLPQGFVLRSDGNRLSNEAALAWIRAWVAGMRDTNDSSGKAFTQAKVAELSGGLLHRNQISRLWKNLGEGKSFAELGVGMPARQAGKAAELVSGGQDVPEESFPEQPDSGAGDPSVRDTPDRGDAAYSVTPAGVGVLIGDGDSALARAARWLPREEDVVGVVLLDHRSRDLDVIEWAVRNSSWNGEDAIRLYACETGDLEPLAIALRQRLGVPVGHPTDLLWLGVPGAGTAVRVGSLGHTEDGRPIWPDADGDGWVWQVEPTAGNRDGRIDGSYRLPVPLGAPFALGLGEPRHLARDKNPARTPEDPPADVVEWRPGAGGVDTLREFLTATDRAEAERPDWLRAWVWSMQQEAVDQTGMRMPAALLEMFSGGLLAVKSVRAYTKKGPESAPEAMVSLVPGWVLAFRAGSGPESFGDLLSFLKANKDRLPLNIWLEPDDKNKYSAPLVRWAGVWVRTVQEEALRKTGAGLKVQKLVALTGGLAHYTSVSEWVAGLTRNDTDDAGGEAAAGEPASLGEGAARPAKNVPEDVVWWRPGAGGADTLREFLEKTGRAEEEHPRWLRAWVLSVQQEAVEQTGMRVPTILLGVLSGDLVTRPRARSYNEGAAAPRPELVASLVPGWVLAFRAGSGPESFGDLLSFLKANKDRLPVNIWLEPVGKAGYTSPLLEWVRAWVREVQSESLRLTGEKLPLTELAKLTGGPSAALSKWTSDLTGGYPNPADDVFFEREEGRSGVPGMTGVQPSQGSSDWELATPRLLPGIPADVVRWRPGIGDAETLSAYLEDTGRLPQHEVAWLREWAIDMHREAVLRTGMRVPAAVLSRIAGDVLPVRKAFEFNAEAVDPRPESVRSLVPEWVMSFRPGTGEGSFGDILSFLKANRHRLPFNIWPEPMDSGHYSEPLVRWVELWLRGVQEQSLRETGYRLKIRELTEYTGGVGGTTAVSRWTKDLSASTVGREFGENPAGAPNTSGPSGAETGGGVPADVVDWVP
ncbi:hypothetical protein AB0E55_39120, partial [Amycolatopsis keratiniphila]|uniref:hypothetical protein n=1 Tax=Amycolatopsis keratiniphila TaxID=129921 RepID=UPI003487C837